MKEKEEKERKKIGVGEGTKGPILQAYLLHGRIASLYGKYFGPIVNL